MNIRHPFLILLAILAISAVIMTSSNLSPALAAGPWFVAPGGDDGDNCLSSSTPCATINGVLAKPGLVAGDTIKVASGTYTGTGSEVVLLDKDVTLSGGWDGTFFTQDGYSIMDGENTRRGIRVSGGVSASMEYFVVQNGYVGSGAGGAGILNDGGILDLSYCTISGNTTAGGGGGIRSYSGSTTTLNHCLISGNTAASSGGISNSGVRMTIIDSTISGNTATDGGGGGIGNGSILTLVNSTISGNQCIGIPANNPGGGGISSGGGTLTLNNSTVSGNTTSSWRGGGIFNGGSSVYLNNSTISNNSAYQVGGIFNNSGSVTSAVVTIQNSIVAGNTADEFPDCYRLSESLGYNLIGNSSECSLTPVSGDLLDVNPVLGPLQDNGGSTYTHALLLTSPAINAGNPSGCIDHQGIPLTTDQRGLPRAQRCDIGSFELQGNYTQVFLPLTLNNYCPILYADDFSDPGSGWPEFDDGEIKFAYENGEYRILVRPLSSVAGASSGYKATDFVVVGDVRNATGVYGSYGLLFGLSDDWSQFYTFEIDPDGNFYVYKYSSGDWTEMYDGWSGAILTGTATNRIMVERNGSIINVYANGVLLASVSDNSYIGSRRVGLVVFSYDQNHVDVRYDNFVVYSVACGVTAADFDQLRDLPELGEMEFDLLSDWITISNDKEE